MRTTSAVDYFETRLSFIVRHVTCADGEPDANKIVLEPYR